MMKVRILHPRSLELHQFHQVGCPCPLLTPNEIVSLLLLIGFFHSCKRHLSIRPPLHYVNQDAASCFLFLDYFLYFESRIRNWSRKKIRKPEKERRDGTRLSCFLTSFVLRSWFWYGLSRLLYPLEAPSTFDAEICVSFLPCPDLSSPMWLSYRYQNIFWNDMPIIVKFKKTQNFRFWLQIFLVYLPFHFFFFLFFLLDSWVNY